MIPERPERLGVIAARYLATLARQETTMADAYGHYDATDFGLQASAERAAANTAPATVIYDGDTHWLECDQCQHPICPIKAGDAFDDLAAKRRQHRHSA